MAGLISHWPVRRYTRWRARRYSVERACRHQSRWQCDFRTRITMIAATSYPIQCCQQPLPRPCFGTSTGRFTCANLASRTGPSSAVRSVLFLVPARPRFYDRSPKSWMYMYRVAPQGAMRTAAPTDSKTKQLSKYMPHAVVNRPNP
jgi:hypothetical protein